MPRDPRDCISDMLETIGYIQEMTVRPATGADHAGVMGMHID